MIDLCKTATPGEWNYALRAHGPECGPDCPAICEFSDAADECDCSERSWCGPEHDSACIFAGRKREKDGESPLTLKGPDPEGIATALVAMWGFASHMVAKHGMDGDDSMTDKEHAMWQAAGGAANAALKGKI